MKTVRRFTRGLLQGLMLTVLGGTHLILPAPVQAQPSGAIMVDYTKTPIITVRAAAPLVMLAMSRDEQLFKKAYADYTDLDGDGLLDTSYNNDFDYSGYFDPNLCYNYGSGRFVASGSANNHQCSGNWSGNFLNWLTMSRLDVLRFVLYGGLRSTDTSSSTRLERAHLPNDLHAWAKVYGDDDDEDTSLYTPFSGTVSFCNASFSSTGTPRLRKANDNWSEWAATAREQCVWRSGSPPGPTSDSNYYDVPSQSSHSGAEFTVRAEVCRGGNNVRESFCRQYEDGNQITYKPAGLLQQYGENGSIRFGLMTGSFSNPRSGGILRRNVGQLAGNNGESCNASDKNEIDLNNGRFCHDESGDEGIINTINRLKIVNNLASWTPSAGVGAWSDCGIYSIHNRVDPPSSHHPGGHLNNPGSTSGSDYDCSAWGNPITEIFAETLRYLTGESGPTSAFVSGTDLDGLPQATWQDPYGGPVSDPRNPYCANCNILVLSTGLNSFDSDEIPDVPKLADDAVTSTDNVGDMEGINGNDYYVGRVVGSISDLAVGNNVNTHEDLCDSRTVGSLANVRGICPDLPSQEGSHLMSGLAYQAWTQDVRPDLDKPDDYKNRIRTYTVALAENLPKLDIPVGDDVISLAPLCQANNNGGAAITSGGWRSCYLGDVIVGQKTSIESDYEYGRSLEADGSAGSFTLVWEDSQWGSDHDNDVVTMITYCVGSAACQKNDNQDNGYGGYDICWRSDSLVCAGSGQPSVGANEVLVRIEHLSAFAGNAMLSGYAIAGSNDDGVKRLIRRPGGNDGSILTGFDDPPGAWDKPNVSRYTTGTSATDLLENPLFYAAKYGGFNYDAEVENPDPNDDPTSWDDIDNETGNTGTDGVPDTYFPVRNPAQLKARLTQVFNDVLKRVSSGTAAAVVANEQTGVGAVYQALYDPIRTDENGNETNWTGSLHALFIDDEGLLREDNNGNGALDNYNTDRVVNIFFDEDDLLTKVRRYSSDEDDVFVESGSTVVPLDELEPIWNARDRLAELANATTQRNYTTSAAGGRHIITWLDQNYNGVIDSGEQLAFDANTFNAGNTHGWLDQPNIGSAQNLVNYIRGEEQANSRNRTIDYYGNGTTRVMRLGDIINSSPVPIAAPFENYDLLTGDSSYFEFRRQYRNRREVVYVGANDGMLHAFNAGFFNASTRKYEPTTDAGGTGAAGDPTTHPLGSELWAYVPKNLLPHLQWLKRPDYEHVYYVDGQPRLFEARVFPDDSDHPGGWGTILVAGFRLGGGTDATGITVDTQADGLGNNNDDNKDSDDIKTKSAYVVMDVTNPEKPPKVLAELTPPNLQFTTSFPTVVPISTPNGGSPNKWYLAFGSGPDDLGNVTSNQNARLYAYDLGQLVSGDEDNGIVTGGGFTAGGLDLGAEAANQFVGDPVIADANLNLKTEALYFGTVGDPEGDEGKLWRMNIDEQVAPDTPEVLLDADQPFSAPPTLSLDENGNIWVIAGTGRFLSAPDKQSIEQQTLYGFRDPYDPDLSGNGLPVTPGQLIDVSDASVFTNGNVDGVDGVTSFTGLVDTISQAGGWRRNYTANGVDPAQRNTTRSTLLSGVIFNTAFMPSLDLCGAEGNSELFGLAFNTGTSTPSPIFGTEPCPSCPDGVSESVPSIDLGYGMASTPSIHVGQPGESEQPGRVTVVVQKSTGETDTETANTGAGINNAEISWREFLD